MQPHSASEPTDVSYSEGAHLIAFGLVQVVSLCKKGDRPPVMSPWFEHRWFALGVQLLLLNGAGVMQAQGADGLDKGKAQVPPELRRLNGLVADWAGTNHLASTPTSPARNDPFVAQFRWLLDGFHLEGTLRYARENRPTQIRITWSFDYDTREYVVQWIDDAWSQATFFRGKPNSDGSILLRTERLVDGATVHETLNFKISKEAWILESQSDFPEPGSTHSTFTAVPKPLPTAR